MLDPQTITIAAATDYAQELKRSFGDVGENQFVTLQHSEQEFLLGFLRLAHPRGDRIDLTTASITIVAKPENCDRTGTSQTCYYIQPSEGGKFHPVWFADCRKMIRSQRLRELGLTSELIAA